MSDTRKLFQTFLFFSSSNSEFSVSFSFTPLKILLFCTNLLEQNLFFFADYVDFCFVWINFKRLVRHFCILDQHRKQPTGKKLISLQDLSQFCVKPHEHAFCGCKHNFETIYKTNRFSIPFSLSSSWLPASEQ